jgi:hypothetical protein
MAALGDFLFVRRAARSHLRVTDPTTSAGYTLVSGGPRRMATGRVGGLVFRHVTSVYRFFRGSVCRLH